MVTVAVQRNRAEENEKEEIDVKILEIVCCENSPRSHFNRRPNKMVLCVESRIKIYSNNINGLESCLEF